jgi:hypothetical protein
VQAAYTVFTSAILNLDDIATKDRGLTMRPVKQALHEIADSLPENCTWEDVMYRKYVRQKIEESLRAAEAGEIIDHEELFKEFED